MTGRRCAKCGRLEDAHRMRHPFETLGAGRLTLKPWVRIGRTWSRLLVDEQGRIVADAVVVSLGGGTLGALVSVWRHRAEGRPTRSRVVYTGLEGAKVKSAASDALRTVRCPPWAARGSK